MDHRRLALIRGGDADGFLRVGTGYLIAPRLVLTARHVVEESRGVPWPRIDVRVGHPRESEVHHCLASVRWTHPEDRDVALLLLDDVIEVPGTVRWGRPVGNAPLPYQGLGYPLASVKDGQYNVEHLRGELSPQAGGAGPRDLYVLDQGPAPDKREDGGKPWSGASGTAIFCQDYLVGVVIHDDDAFANRRLHACPARVFADDPGFVALLQRYGDGPPQLVDIAATRPPEETPPSRVLVPHAEVMAELAGARAALSPDRLPYVEPSPRYQGNPGQILARLASVPHGVLVTGPAGMGKTRLCLEVASRAQRDGWQVLHPAPGVSAERALEAARKSGGQRTLLVLDDLPPGFAFDPHVASDAVTPSGVRTRRVTILAAAGPAALAALRARGVARYFTEIAVPDTAVHLRKIRERVLDSSAGALTWRERGWRPEDVAELCGLRPGLAVLIASAIGSRGGGPLRIPRRFRQPGEELPRWLQTHLREDGLCLPSSPDDVEPSPGPVALACAVALLSCPQPRAAVQAAVEAALRAWAVRRSGRSVPSPADSGIGGVATFVQAGDIRFPDGDAPSEGAAQPSAEAVVDRLLGRGWLVEHEGLLHSLHDLVTDEVLRHCLIDPSGTTLHPRESEALLAAAFSGTVTWNRFVTGLHRFCSEAVEESVPPLVKRMCRRWFRRNARRIGGLLGEGGQAVEAEQTLCSLLASPLWHKPLIADWATVAEPCLARAEREGRAFKLLPQALTACSEDTPVPRPLVKAALGWLRRNPGHTSTPFLLGALLSRLEHEAGSRALVEAHAMDWIGAHGRWITASRVFGPLLASPGLTDEQVVTVAGVALRWLDKHGGDRRASYVLRPLLELFTTRPTLPEELRDRVDRYALAWLRIHDTDSGHAHFVLRPLLDPAVIRPEVFRRTVPHALRWFARHGREGNANTYGMAAHQLLGGRADGASALDTVLDWLGAHNNRAESVWILVAVLRLKEHEIPLEQARRAVRHALVWLDAHPGLPEAKEVIERLAGRGVRKSIPGSPKARHRRELTVPQGERVARHAADWMDANPGKVDAQFLRSLLGFWHYQNVTTGQRIAAHALRWLRQNEHGRRSDDDYMSVLAKLMRRGRLTEDQPRELVDRARRWMEHTERPPTQEFHAGLLRLLVKYPRFGAQVPSLVDAVLRWLSVPSHRSAPKGAALPEGERAAQAVLLTQDTARYLIAVRGLDAERLSRIARHVLDWLAHNGDRPLADRVLRPMLQRTDLPPEYARQAVSRARTWLRRWGAPEHAKTVREGPAWLLVALLRRPELTPRQLREAADSALAWMQGARYYHNSGGRRRLAWELLTALLKRLDLDTGRVARAFQQALADLGENAPLLLNGPASTAEGAEDTADGAEEDADDDLPPDTPGPSLEDAALAWLDTYHEERDASVVIGFLASRLRFAEVPDEAAIARVIGYAHAWLARYGEHLDARHVLPAFLDTPESLGDAARPFLEAALRWLDQPHPTPTMRQVLRHALDHPLLTGDEQRTLARLAFAWLEEHSTDIKASYVLRPLCGATYLTEAEVGLLTDRVVAWTRLALSRLEYLGSRGMLKKPNTSRPDPRYVLQKLLARPDLPPPQLALALGAAMAVRSPKGLPVAFDWKLPEPWSGTTPDVLTRYAFHHADALAELPEARELVLQLLNDSEPSDRPEPIDLALRWLRVHGRTLEAGGVCSWLLRVLKSTSSQLPEAIRHAFAWLDTHPDAPGAEHVLKHLLLTVPDVVPGEETPPAPRTMRAVPEHASDVADTVFRYATAWLSLHAHTLVAGEVLAPLLNRRDLPPERLRTALAYAEEWLKEHGADPVARFVLDAVLPHGDVLSETRREDLVTLALAWTVRHSTLSQETGEIIEGCLALSTGHPERIFDAALDWRGQNPEATNANSVVIALLAHPALAEDRFERTWRYAMEYLDREGTTQAAHTMLTACLSRTGLSREDAARLHERALLWADRWHTTPVAAEVLAGLLRRKDLGSGAARRVASLALDYWVERFPRMPAARCLLHLVLARTDLLDDQYELAVELLTELEGPGA